VPVLHSLEQTGFRGSLSLGLETGIAVIRDIAEQLESQNFTRLVIVNFHAATRFSNPLRRTLTAGTGGSR
jgi:creatinine amidohydrolase/Fe(II)-dependent formamide hydrolase-like protein